MMLDDTLKTISANYQRLLARKPHAGSRMDLAKRIGVGDGTLGRIMYGTGNPGVDTLVQLANYFHVEPWELLFPADGHVAAVSEVRDQQPINIDVDALTDAIEWVNKALDEADLTVSKRKRSRAIALVYARILEVGAKLRSADIVELIRKVA